MNFTDIHISQSHTVHDMEIGGIGSKGYVGGWYVGLCLKYGGMFHYDMAIPLLSPINPKYWR